ncbi:unnamed protein product [Pylaiella littoralis]
MRLCPLRRSQCARSPLSLFHADGVCEHPMGQTIAKRALVSKHASIYDTSMWARKYRHDFEALQLSEEQVRLMWDEYCKIDEDKSGEISLWELFEALDMKQSKFTKRIFRIFDEDGSGSVDFREFVMSLWNYCTLSKAALIMFAFDLYDNDNSGEIDLGEVELLLKEVYGREFQSSTQAQTIMAKLRGGDLGIERNINVDQFREFCRTHPAVLYPAFVLQTQIQVKILGSKFWLACSNARIKLSNGEYVSTAGILQAHVNEKAFKDIVETKEAVAGKQATPSASADNVAMLQLSGTLANRRVLRTAINTHMTSIRAMAVNTDGTNAGAIQEEAAQGDNKIEVATAPATISGAEWKKGVSWGTVKTHKVYVIDSDGEDNGSVVVEPGTTTQVPPETPEATNLPTEPAASAGLVNGAVTRAATTKLISPGGTSQKILVTRQESKLLAISHKSSSARPRPSAGTASRTPLMAEKTMPTRRKTGQPARGGIDGPRR